MENFIGTPIKIIYCKNHSKKVAVIEINGDHFCQTCLNKLKEKAHVHIEKQFSFDELKTTWMAHVGKVTTPGDKVELNIIGEEYDLEFTVGEEEFLKEKGKKKNNMGLVKTSFGDRYFTLPFIGLVGEKFIGYFSEMGYCAKIQLENGKIINRAA